jgi:glutamine phosphoribosylpyrophosphate amidotransferase
MCGVLGITIENFNDEDGDLVRRLFHQSMIRGKHATGVSYVKNEKVNTIKEPLAAKEFIDKQDIKTWINEDGNLYCIGHIRYSTSDLRFNQPMATDELSIVHNGVISQEPPESWFYSFGYETVTHNDSELVLRALQNGDHPLEKFKHSSMAVCTIDKNKKLTAFRNEARPLYYYSDSRMTVFASTADILKRSGVDFEKTEMYRIYTVEEFTLSSIGIPTNVKDLQ